MREENVQYFTEAEEEIIRLLTATGMKKNAAKAMVVVMKTPGITSRAIEREADLRQPDVSIVMNYFGKRGWITSHESLPGKGRPAIVYDLAKPLAEIMMDIEEEQKARVDEQLARVGKLRGFVKKEF